MVVEAGRKGVGTEEAGGLDPRGRARWMEGGLGVAGREGTWKGLGLEVEEAVEDEEDAACVESAAVRRLRWW